MKKFSRVIAILLCVVMVISTIPAAAFAAEEKVAPVSAAPVVTKAADAPLTPPKPIYQDESYSYAERAADMVSRMSAEEKVSQTAGYNAPAIPSLGIETYMWWNEALHGYSQEGWFGAQTDGASFPSSYSMGASWDVDLYYQEAEEIGAEIRERVKQNRYNLTMFSPNVNLARDPRWGRNDESYGEDPLVVGKLAAAFVNGVEGKTQDGKYKLTNANGEGMKQAVTTIKHYAANNSEKNRYTSGADNVTVREMREYYTRAPRIVIQDSDVSSVMMAYSSVSGIPISFSSYYMDTILRQSYGFSGYIVSDCDSVATSYNRNVHKNNPHTGKNYTLGEAFANAQANGLDLQCNAGETDNLGSYAQNYAKMLKNADGTDVLTDKGKYTETQLEVSTHRLMTKRMELGEFDADNKYATIGAAGLAAGNAGAYVNGAAGQTQKRIELGDETSRSTIVLLKNDNKALPITESAINGAADGKYNVAIVGPIGQSNFRGGYSSRSSNERNLVTIEQAIKTAFNDTTTYSQNAINKLDVQYYYGYTGNPNRSSFTGLRSNNIDISGVANDLDLVIVTLGQGSGDSREDGDRTDLRLGQAQIDLLNQVKAKNPKKLVLIMETYGPIQMVSDLTEGVDAILWSCFNGFRKGTGFGEAITGKNNPSGRTNATWLADCIGDIPGFFDYSLFPVNGKGGRSYMYNVEDTIYPFGFGLSYSDVDYAPVAGKASILGAASKGGLRFNANDRDSTINVSFQITNTNNVEGKQVAEVYAVSPGAGTNNIPLKRLVGFDKVNVPANGTTVVEIPVKLTDLAFFNEEKDCFEMTPGEWQIWVARSSDLNAETDLVESFQISTAAIREDPEVLSVKPTQPGDENLGVSERVIFQMSDDESKNIVDPGLAVTMTNEKIYGVRVINNVPGIDIGVDADAVNAYTATTAQGWTVPDSAGKVARLETGKSADELPKVGTKFVLPADYKVSYSSNRPAVVQIGSETKANAFAAGPIQMKGMGVATITAKVESPNGVAATTEFVVYVEGTTELREITVGGQPLAGFDPGVYGYELNAADFAEIPAVAAVGGPGLEVEVQQFTGKPGYATVTVTCESLGQRVVYRIGLNNAPKAADFAAGAAEGFAFINGDAKAAFGANGLTITGQSGNIADNSAKNIYAQNAGGDWVAQTNVSLAAALAANGQQVGLTAMDNGSNNVQLVYEVVNGSKAVSAYKSIAGERLLVDRVTLDAGEDVSFQLVKQGSLYTFRYSNDGKNWSEMGNKAAVPMGYPMMGVFALGEGTEAAFDGINLFKTTQLYPRLSGIKVGSKAVDKFDPEKFSYSVAASGSKVPTVTGLVDDPDLTVEVEQAAEFGAAATIHVYSAASSATYTVKIRQGGGKVSSIDFTNPADAALFDIANQANAAIEEGVGLKLTATRPAFEPCNGQNSGDQATTPQDAVIVPVSGDWSATLKFDFGTGSASNGYYQFFGFYAGEGDDYQNLAGIRGGDGAMQNFLRVDGSITADSADMNSTPGLASGGTYFYQIIKEGDTYTCLRSNDGEEFTEMFTYEATGIEADRIIIDAYTGMTEGYEFTLKSLNIEGGAAGLPTVDFKDPASEGLFEVINPVNAAIAEGTGLTLTATRPAFEPCNGQNSGDQATNPADVIAVPVTGDWEAVLEFDFSTGSARNGYYQFFGFFAAEGDDYQNLAGIRGGDGAMQNFLRVDGTITADSSDLNSTPGLASGGTYWYKITKEGTTYTCARSADGEEFTDMFAYEETGIEADKILIDAYTGMTEGYEFTLKMLSFGGSVPTPPPACEHDYAAVVTAPTCTAKGFTTYTCSKCGDSYVADETAALGHQYESVVTAPTCTEDGFTTYTCSVCDDSYKGNTVAAKGHTWGEAVITKEATETENGIKTYTCTVCGETKEESYSLVAVMHTVTFDFNFIGAPEPVQVQVEDGKTVEPIEAPARLGYMFTSWGTERVFWGSFVFVMPYDFSTPVTADITLKASWDKDWTMMPSLTGEYEGYFIQGCFGGSIGNAQNDYHYSTLSGNNGKLTYNIGGGREADGSGTTSRTAYEAAVAEINADASLTEAQKAAKIEEANRNVELVAGEPGLFSTLRAIRQWNEENPDKQKKYYRQHVLAWHGSEQPKYFFCNGFYYDAANPDWASPETMLARLDSYIQKMFERYVQFDDVILSWDVVNEAIDDYSGQIRNYEDYQVSEWGLIFRRPDLDNDPDARLYAESAWVRQAFESAYKWREYYGGHWTLYYNDFQDSDKRYQPKMGQTIKMLQPIHEAGHIDGFGMQGRLAYAYPSIDLLRQHVELGLTVANEVSFSEADIRSDFEPNPYFDPNRPSTRVTADDPQWPENSGSVANISLDNGNTFDVHNSPVYRNPDWGVGSLSDMATDPEIMTKQADFAADVMDILLDHHDQVVAVAWDGNNDASTFNRTTGCHLWDRNGNEKYSFFAVIGAPNRYKMREAIAAGPAISEETKYTAATWAPYAAALEAAEALVDVRIYDLDGVNAVKDATADLLAATEALEEASASAGGYVLADKIEPGKTYVIVANDSLAITNAVTAKAVTVADGKLTGEVTEDMLWNFKDVSEVFADSPAASNGSAQFFIFAATKDTDNFLQRGTGSGGEDTAAIVQVAAFPNTARWARWSFEPRADGSYTMYANTERDHSSDYAFTLNVSEYDINCTNSYGPWDDLTASGSSIRLYELAEGAEEPGLKPGPNVVKDPASPTGYTVKFLYENPTANTVTFAGDIGLKNWADTSDSKSYTPFEYKPGLMRAGSFTAPMEKLTEGEYAGWWYYELPLAAGANQYWFYVDGNNNYMVPDPYNAPLWSPNSAANKNAYNAVYVPYDPVQNYEPMKAREAENPRTDGQSGTWSYVPLEIGGRTHYMGVYLPYGYDADRAEPYKTIYMLHGMGQDESDWMGIGSVQKIMDNLSVEGRTEAAVIVSVTSNNNFFGSNYANIPDVILPFIEKNYNVSTKAENRAWAGLSMGSSNTQSMINGGKAALFGYYGAFSLGNSVSATTADLDKTHILFGDGSSDFGALNASALAGIDQINAAGGFAKFERVCGGHDFNTWCQLFRIWCEDYLWNPEAFGDVGSDVPHEHAYTAKVTAPTCTEAGYTTYTCDCGDSYVADEVAALGHSWDNGVVTKQATTTETGIRTYTCTRCGETRTEVIPAIGDLSYEDVLKAAQKDAEDAEAAAQAAEKQAEQDKKAAEDAQAAADKAQADADAAQKAADAAKADANADKAAVEAAQKAADEAQAAADKAQADADAAQKALDESKAKAEELVKASELSADKYDALADLINAAVELDISDFDETQIAAFDKLIADSVAAIWAAKDAAAVDAALAAALEALKAGFPGHIDITFEDMPAEDNWAYAGIAYCVYNGYMNGVSETKFAPSGDLTRGQLVTILYRIAGEPEMETKVNFSDVPEGKFYSAAINWAAQTGVVNGYPDGTFRPEAKITREQIATILYRFAGSPEVTGNLNAYPDSAKVSAYAHDAMIWATSNGLITGIATQDGVILSPKTNASRAQIATLIMRYLEAAEA